MSAEANSDKHWEIARSYASMLKPIPSSVTSAASALWANYALNRIEGSEEISQKGFDSIRLVDKSAVLKTPIYFAASKLYTEKFQSMEEDDASKALLRVLGPSMFASLLTLIYFHRRLNKLAAGLETWETFSKEYVLNMELGFIVGTSIPKLSPGLGVLLGGVRYAALATFMLRDDEQFMNYRESKKKRFDLTFEREHWGCDHGHVAAMLLKNVGIRPDQIEVARAFQDRYLELDAKPKDELQEWAAGIDWIESVKDGSIPPENKNSSSVLGVEGEMAAEVRAKTEALFSQGSSFTWMFAKTSSEKNS